MKIQSSLLVLAAMVGSATAANKRKRVFKIYSREEIQAADGTRSLQQQQGDDDTNSEVVPAVSSMSMTSAPSASTIVSPTPASEPPTANPTAPTTDQLPQESLPFVVVAQNEGDRCGTTEDAECAGSLKCGKKSYWDETYVCCKDTFVPFGWVTDLCVAQNEGDRCGTTEDAECAGSLECGKRSESDETYVCCKDTFVPFGWVTDLCVGSVQNEGDRCGTTEDAECAGSLKCGKKSYWDETYVCCKDTFVPFGWVTDLCVAQNEGDRCGTTEDAECAGSLECGKRSESDETYVCCKDTFVPFGWVTDLCVGSVQNEGDRCGTTEDAECAGSLKCGKKSYWDETYVCCKDTFVPFGWVTDLCVAQNEGDRCGTTEDAECAGSLECGKRSKSDETYVCCKDTFVPWFWFTDVCL